MKTIVFATSNANKLKEMKQILKNVKLLSLKDIGFSDEIDETGTTFLANALIKAQTIYSYLEKNGNPMPVLAEDSGLEVDALEGAPGIFSARYSATDTEPATSENNRKKLLDEMEGIVNRKANFTATEVLYSSPDDIKFAVGKTFGEISYAESGDLSFGYDPIFYSYDLEDKFSEVSLEEKDSVSHRNRAIICLLNNPTNIYMMKLNPEYYNLVANGEKTIEVRLLDEKRQKLREGDYLAFTNTSNGDITVTQIVSLAKFKDFNSCITNTGTKKVGFNGSSIEDTVKVYNSIYPKVDEEKYGVLAIGLTLLK